MLNNLLCMSRLRRSLTDEEYEIDKVRAKMGMRQAREKGFKMSHIRRVGRDIKEPPGEDNPHPGSDFFVQK